MLAGKGRSLLQAGVVVLPHLCFLYERSNSLFHDTRAQLDASSLRLIRYLPCRVCRDGAGRIE